MGLQDHAEGEAMSNQCDKTGEYDLSPTKAVTARELFAGLAMHALLANPGFAGTPPAMLSRFAVERADYLLEALK